MSEIKNNDVLKHFNPVAKVAKPKTNESKAKNNNAEEVDSEQHLRDLGNSPAEAIGRSQVSKADNLVNDMNFMRQNPKLVLHADEFFDYTLNQFVKEGKADAYEQACIATARFINEFAKKTQVQI